MDGGSTLRTAHEITEEAVVLVHGQVPKPATSPEDQDGSQCSSFKCVDRRLFSWAVNELTL